MCSIEGFTGKHQFTIQDFTAFNKNRGPDDTQYYVDENVSIGHNLLAIQNNPDGVSQPYVDSYGNVLAYNGEIYAHKEKLLTEFDTVFLSNLLRQSGNHSGAHPAKHSQFSQLYNNIDGMWAFAYYQPSNKSILLCRDHFGVKPLYYLELNGNLFWSSTVKPLVAVLHHYDQYSLVDSWRKRSYGLDGWLVSPVTQYDKIKSVFPGQYLTWSIEKRKFIRKNGCLWRESGYTLSPNYNYDPEELREILLDSMDKIFSVGDQKKAVSLSGGLDSTLILSTQKVRKDVIATSVKFDGKVDENTHEAYMHEHLLAKHTCELFDIPYTEAIVTEDYEKRFEEVYTMLGQHYWISSRVIPRLYNIENAYKNGAKIYYTGDLADEIVTGYGSHQDYFIASRRFGVMKEGTNIDEFRNSYPLYGPFLTNFPSRIFAGDEVNNNLFLRLMMSTESFCTIIDHICGEFGMESRVPYLYQRFAKYAMRIPSAHKLRVPFIREKDCAYQTERSIEKTNDGRWTPIVRGNYKWLFREEFADYLPDHIRKNVEKVGFSTPWNSRNQELNNVIRDKEVNTFVENVPYKYRFDCDKK